MLPEQAEGPNIALPSAADKMCFMYLLNNQTGQPPQQTNSSQQNGSSTIDKAVFQLTLSASAVKQRECSLLVFCQVQLQPERATSWIQGLLSQVQAQHVLVVASLPVRMLCVCLSYTDVASHHVSCRQLQTARVETQTVTGSIQAHSTPPQFMLCTAASGGCFPQPDVFCTPISHVVRQI